MSGLILSDLSLSEIFRVLPKCSGHSAATTSAPRNPAL